MGVHNTEVYPQIKKLLEIPEDEPIFILRGQDKAAWEAISHYADVTEIEYQTSAEFNGEIAIVLEEFMTFKKENPDRMKVPD